LGWRVRGQIARLVLLVAATVGVTTAVVEPSPAASQPPLALAPAPSDPVLLGFPRTGVHADRRRRLAPPGALALLVGRQVEAPPEVRMLAPAPLHAPLDATMRLEFSDPMEEATVERSFRIEPAVAGSLEWPDARTLLFHPSQPLAYRTAYQVLVSGRAAGGHRLMTAGRFGFATVWPPPAVPFPFTLTFDDCGTAEAILAIMDALADRGLHAIFFPTGMCRDQFPWLVPTLLAAGHRVCNHTYSHPVLPRLSNGAIASEIQRGVSAGCDLFRPPYGAMDATGRIPAIAASFSYHIQLWDVDTRDWAGTPADVMDAMIRARGGIVLMHMHGLHTVEAIRTL